MPGVVDDAQVRGVAVVGEGGQGEAAAAAEGGGADPAKEEEEDQLFFGRDHV